MKKQTNFYKLKKEFQDKIKQNTIKSTKKYMTNKMVDLNNSNTGNGSILSKNMIDKSVKKIKKEKIIYPNFFDLQEKDQKKIIEYAAHESNKKQMELIKRGKLVEDILKAVQDEFFEHKDCGFEIGCVLTSQILFKEVYKLIEEYDAQRKINKKA